jgi:hypothetical protein
MVRWLLGLLVVGAGVAAFIAWMYLVKLVFTFWWVILAGIVGWACVVGWFKKPPPPPDKIIEIRHR